MNREEVTDAFFLRLCSALTEEATVILLILV